MELINQYAQLILTIATILTLIVLIWYTTETRKLRLGQDSIVKQNTENDEPNVIISFEEGKEPLLINLEIENIGNKTAFDIKIIINPPFDIKDKILNKHINESSIIKNGITILKSSKVITLFAAMTNMIKENETFNYNYSFKVIYKDQNDKTYSREYFDSLSKFLTRAYVNTDNIKDVIEVLEKINSNLETKKIS